MASFFTPLTARLYRVVAAYIVVAWFLFQALQETVLVLNERGWIRLALLASLAIGFVIVLVLVWRLSWGYRFMTRPIGKPLDVVLAIALLIVMGLQSYRWLTLSLPDDVVDSRWLWVSVSSPGGDVVMPDCCTVQFEHRRWLTRPAVVVRTDCNDARGSYSVGRYGSLAVRDMVETKLPCIGPTGNSLIELIGRARSYVVNDDELALETPAATIRLKRCTGPHVYEDEKARQAGCV